MGLKFPREWKSSSDGVVVPPELLSAAMVHVRQIAKRSGSSQEYPVVQKFKFWFANHSNSSSMKWAYADLQKAMEESPSGAAFADSFWCALEDLREGNGEKNGVLSLAQVNRLFEQHGFPYQIEPPNLIRVDAPASPPPPTVKAPTMPTCFVAQPFKDPFQSRFYEDIKPAIEAAGLVAYKVDDDLSADKLIDDIHAGIRAATVVLVDITEDNPNVWYELGFSQALDKHLVMISCSNDRGADRPYPFDVRGRKIVNYTTGKRSAHDKLQKDITERIMALLVKEETTLRPPAQAVSAPPPAEATPNGLATMDPRTRAAFVAIVGLSTGPADGVTPEQMVKVMPEYSLADVNIAVRVLVRRGLVERGQEEGEWGKYLVVRLSDAGEDFVFENHIHFAAKPPPPPRPQPLFVPVPDDDDIPF